MTNTTLATTAGSDLIALKSAFGRTTTNARGCFLLALAALLYFSIADAKAYGIVSCAWQGDVFLGCRTDYYDGMDAGSMLGFSAYRGGDSDSSGEVGGGALAFNRGQLEADRDASIPTSGAETTGCSNPIVMATGNKIELETDFVTGGEEMPLYLQRTYNHYWPGIGLFGKQWVSNFDYQLTFWNSSSTAACYPDPGNYPACTTIPDHPSVLWAYRPDGRRIRFTWNATANAWLEDKPDAVAKIVVNADGTYTHFAEDNTTEHYSNIGYILERKNAAGIGWTFSYISQPTSGNPNGFSLNRVTHTSGRYVQFAWGYGNLKYVKDPAGNQYNYTYDADYFGADEDLLISATRPGTSPTTITYHYEVGGGNLTGKSYNGVRYSTFAYGTGDVAISSEHAGGVDKHTFAYTLVDGAITSVLATNPLGKKTTFQFADGKITSVAGAGSTYCGATYKERTYDSNGYENLVFDEEGNVTDFDYNAKGQLLKQVEAYGTSAARTTQYTWDTVKNRVTKVTVVGVSETAFTFNTDNRIATVKVKNLLSGSANLNQIRTVTYTYTKHANGLLSQTTVDGPLPGPGDAVSWNFNSLGDLTSQVDALGTAATYSNYNGLGFPGRVVSRTGVQTDFTYDAQGRTVSATRTVAGVAATTSRAYDAAGLPAYDIAGDGLRTDYTHTSARRLTKLHRDAYGMVVGNAENEERTLEYNAAGDALSTKDWAAVGHYVRQFHCLYPEGAPKTQCVEPEYISVWVVEPTVERSNFTDYDELSRVRAQRGNNGQNVRFGYDDNGNVKTITDSLNKVTTLTYDALDRVVTSTDPLGGVTRFAYNKGGQLASVTDPRNLVTTYTYDGFGQLWTQTSPDTGTTRFAYDAYGRRTSMTRADGTASAVTTTFGYDTLGRVTSITANSQVQTFAYDSCTNGSGRVCTVSDPSGSVAYTYTATGQIASQVTQYAGGGTANFSFTYDKLDRISTVLNVLSGVRTNYTYSYGRLSAVTVTIAGVTKNVATGMTYEPLGPVANWTYGNGLVRSQLHDLDGRLTAIASSTATQSQGYGYNANNDLTVLTNTANTALTQSYTYDALSRVTGAGQGSGASDGFALDANGNRTTHTVNGAARTLTMAASSNQLVNIAGGGVSRAFTYDAFGNRLAETGTNGTFGYAYDAFNRMSAVNKNGASTTYRVNALGQRTEKSGPAGTVRYVHGPVDGVLADYTSDAGYTDYIWAQGAPIALVRGGALYFLHNDQLGRPEVATNSAKAVVWRANNTVFDRIVTIDSIGGVNLGFPGQLYDSESGTWNNGFRDYDASTGRYLQSDPIGLGGGINSYAYVGGNPVTRNDPLGLEDSQAVLVGAGVISQMPDRTGSDYYHANVNLYVASFSVTVTRSGTVYVGSGATKGTPSSTVSGKLGWSVTAGDVDSKNTCPPTAADVDNVINGGSSGVSAFYGVGGGKIWNSSGSATEGGFGLGGGYVPVEYNHPVGNIGFGW
jgi:RHS repeat-associated protein